jgi:hypothetical protein
MMGGRVQVANWIGDWCLNGLSGCDDSYKSLLLPRIEPPIIKLVYAYYRLMYLVRGHQHFLSYPFQFSLNSFFLIFYRIPHINEHLKKEITMVIVL